MTTADFKKTGCEMKLKGGPASGMTVVMPLSSQAGLWFLYAGKVHHYRGTPGRPGTVLEYVEEVPQGPTPAGELPVEGVPFVPE